MIDKARCVWYTELVMNPLKRLYRSYRSYRIKRQIATAERSFGEEYPVRYLLERHSSEDLIVVYSAFPVLGERASYNYLAALFSCRANKLFLLDEYGPDGAGCYYLGENGRFAVRDNVTALIRRVEAETGAKRVFHVGSSKGGWAALYFGLAERDSVILAGGPQYLLGNYLDVCMHPLYRYITGEEVTAAGIERLNRLLSDRVKAGGTQKIFLHYSAAEHTYNDQIAYLLHDLKQVGYDCLEDVANYPEHREVGLYFADYLTRFFKHIDRAR